MKMVSQLTRQAMSRHRLLASLSIPSEPTPEPAAQQPLRGLYAAPPAVSPPESAHSSVHPFRETAPVRPSLPTYSPPPQRTIYGELMKKHDQFTERHLIRP